MKVRDLIQDTIWRPSRNHGGAAPLVSVLLPTFRGGADRLFMKAATSVLKQTLRELELIIIDDASTDGTADLISALMAADPRVGCLTHPSNIGLPAVSQYEALRRARGEYIAFAFDDFVFEPDALAALLRESRQDPNTVVHGYVDDLDRQGQPLQLGREPISHDVLNYYNFLEKSSFLVSRQVIDDVGFFDPHIAAVRFCDWDLWRRIHRRYHIRRVNILVGGKHDGRRNHGLGNSYPCYAECMQEYFGTSRNAQLRPDAMADFDVWRMPFDATATLAAQVLALRRVFHSKSWATAESISSAEDIQPLIAPKRATVGIFGVIEPSISIVFDGLLAAHQQNFLFITPEFDDRTISMFIARCDAVVIVRQLLDLDAQRAIAVCIAMDIPLYFYTDDNFAVLSDYHPIFAKYRPAAVAKVLSKFKGVFLTSPILRQYFQLFRMHHSIEILTPTFDFDLRAKLGRLKLPPRGSDLRIGFFGGDFRVRHLIEAAVPALADVNRESPLRLFVRSSASGLDKVPFQVTKIELYSFGEFIVRWRELQIDILIHPRGDYANIDYKTANSLLVAHYLDAVLIVCDEPAYRDIDERHGVLKIDGSTRSWEQAIRRAQDARLRGELRVKLEAYCKEEFSPRHNEEVLQRLFAGLDCVDLCTWNERMARAALPVLDEGLQARIAWLEAGLASRAYRFALVLRKTALLYRGLRGWFGAALRRMMTVA